MYVLKNWSYLCKILATLTPIATPRYSEGAGISGDVGRLLRPLFIVTFRLWFRIKFCYCYWYVLRLPMQRFRSARGVSDITFQQIIYMCWSSLVQIAPHLEYIAPHLYVTDLSDMYEYKHDTSTRLIRVHFIIQPSLEIATCLVHLSLVATTTSST